MGGCATKPKVLKDSTDAEDKKAPEPIEEETSEAAAQTQPEKLVAAEPKVQTQSVIDKPHVQEIVDADDDQANRRRSLSSLFKDKQVFPISHFPSFYQKKKKKNSPFSFLPFLQLRYFAFLID